MLMGCLILISLSLTFYRTFVSQNYALYYSDDCNPDEESCFIYYCNPYWEECTGNPEDDVWYYKIYERSTQKATPCESLRGECSDFVCSEGEEGCSVIYCNPTVEEECSERSL